MKASVAPLVLCALLAATSVDAQAPAPSPATERPTLGAAIDAGALGDLPSSDNVFAILDTTQAEVISDRFSAGGLNTGRSARVGSFLNSWRQTEFRVGDVNVTVPDGSGAPFLFPMLTLWERVNVATGLLPSDVSAPALAVSLEPRRPTATWIRVADLSASGSGLAADTAPGRPPAIERPTGWSHGSVLISGPLVPGRLGLAAAGGWSRSSELERGSTPEVDGHVASGFANLVFTPKSRDEIRTVGWVQQARYPFANRGAYRQPLATDEDVSAHLQSTWERRRQQGTAWRAFAAYSQRNRTHDVTVSAVPVAERLTDGPIPELVETGARTDRRWSLGARITGPAQSVGAAGGSNGSRPTHTLMAGLDVGGGRARVAPGFTGVIGELVNDARARQWNYSGPGIDARRHETTFAGFVADRVVLNSRLTLDAAIRYDGVTGEADGAMNGIAWQTWLPQAAFRWTLTDTTALFGGYRRAADQLTLDTLAFGDPAAPVATVSRWTNQGVGALVARVGPGAGGGPAFATIDGSLERPLTDEFVFGIQSRRVQPVRVRLWGIAKRERHLIAVVDTGAPASSYATLGVNDPRPELDEILPVYNRLPASFGLDRYVLTNPSQDPATFAALVLTADASTDRLFLLFGATASITDTPAANRGFHATENDVGALGELFTDPNAATFARGRLFLDRAFTIKWTTVYRFAKDVRLGVIARYQDGQPFSRVVVVPDLNQGAEIVRAYANGNDTRFMYTGTLDVRLQKGFAIGRRRIDAVVDAYNIINLGNEVEERVATGPGFRTITAVQPPLAVHLGVRVTF